MNHQTHRSPVLNRFHMTLLPSNVASDCPATHITQEQSISPSCVNRGPFRFTNSYPGCFESYEGPRRRAQRLTGDDGDSSVNLSTAQVAYDNGTGEKCCASWMLTGNPSFNFGYCEISCGRCGWVKLASPAPIYRSAQNVHNPFKFWKPSVS